MARCCCCCCCGERQRTRQRRSAAGEETPGEEASSCVAAVDLERVVALPGELRARRCRRPCGPGGRPRPRRTSAGVPAGSMSSLTRGGGPERAGSLRPRRGGAAADACRGLRPFQQRARPVLERLRRAGAVHVGALERADPLRARRGEPDVDRPWPPSDRSGSTASCRRQRRRSGGRTGGRRSPLAFALLAGRSSHFMNLAALSGGMPL